MNHNEMSGYSETDARGKSLVASMEQPNQSWDANDTMETNTSFASARQSINDDNRDIEHAAQETNAILTNANPPSSLKHPPEQQGHAASPQQASQSKPPAQQAKIKQKARRSSPPPPLLERNGTYDPRTLPRAYSKSPTFEDAGMEVTVAVAVAVTKIVIAIAMTDARMATMMMSLSPNHRPIMLVNIFPQIAPKTILAIPMTMAK